MADDKPPMLQRSAMPGPNREPGPDAGHIPMTEEFDKAKWTMPPLGVVGGVLAVLAVIIGIVSFVTRPKPAGAGSVSEAYAIAMPDNTVLAAVTLTLRNTTEKPLWIRNIKARIKTDQGEFTDDAANAVDFERYFQAFPDLRSHSIQPLKVETKIMPGAQEGGTLIVSFPVTVENFNARKSLSVIVEPYDQRPITITK
ncbi:MAG: hypothetical protein ACE14M_14610 [Terriglobales bacterium]